MLRTVADETPRPAAVTSRDDATGSPEAMYSRTRAASTRFDLSVASGVIYGWQSLPRTAKFIIHGRASSAAHWYTGAGSKPAGRLPRLTRKLHRVRPDRRKIVDEHLTVDNRRADVAAARRINQRRIRIGSRH
jgi:hypothetical protein